MIGIQQEVRQILAEGFYTIVINNGELIMPVTKITGLRVFTLHVMLYSLWPVPMATWTQSSTL